MYGPCLRGNSNGILVVEDECNVREGLGALLESAGFEVVMIANSDLAHFLLSFLIFTAVVTDITMPGCKCDGIDLLTIIRERSLIPVVLISGKVTEHQTKQAYLRLGANAFFEKPFSPKEFIRSMKHPCCGFPSFSL